MWAAGESRNADQRQCHLATSSPQHEFKTRSHQAFICWLNVFGVKESVFCQNRQLLFYHHLLNYYQLFFVCFRNHGERIEWKVPRSYPKHESSRPSMEQNYQSGILSGICNGMLMIYIIQYQPMSSSETEMYCQTLHRRILLSFKN